MLRHLFSWLFRTRVTRLEVLHVSERAVLIIEIHDRLTLDMMRNMADRIEERVGLKALILDRGAKLTAVVQPPDVRHAH